MRPTKELSPREVEVVELLAKGATIPKISMELGIARSTAKNYLTRVREKLDVHTKAEAVAVWTERKIKASI